MLAFHALHIPLNSAIGKIIAMGKHSVEHFDKHITIKNDINELRQENS